ncbi:MAG TPA: multidrug effflux MFS transporter [Gammaproteobacteria bacterium]|nr:multidrug effflux MFS transporter [Gammaproteobacteria bacterium]
MKPCDRSAVKPLTGARRIETIAILGALMAFAPLSNDMYLPALPAIARDFQSSIGAIEHTVAAGLLGLCLGQSVFGPLTDRFGRRAPLYGGLVLFAAASAACALCQGAGWLTGLRFVQAVGACACVVIARACVRDLFPPDEGARIFSYTMLVLGMAPLLAPLIGGYLLVSFGWQSIFVLQCAIGGLVLGAVYIRLPAAHGGSARAMHPLQILRDYRAILADRRFLAFSLAGGISNAGMFAYITGSPHVFIDLFHVPAQDFGWFFGANALGIVVFSQLNARLLRRRRTRRVLLTAQLFQSAFGVLLLAVSAGGFGGVWGIELGLFGYVALTGAVMPSAIGLALRSFGSSAGMAAALFGTLQFAAATIASVIVGVLPSGSALPMSAVVAGSGTLALLLHVVLSPVAELRADA